MTALLLALTLTVAPMTHADAVPRDPERGCGARWPETIRVHLTHKRGSSTPARVVTMDFPDYVGAILASGAAPATKPMAALRAVATVVAARAHWFVCHPQPGYVWHGRRYDIHSGTARKALRGRADAGQYLQPGIYVHSRIKRAVAAVHGVLMRRPDGSMRKPQWTGGAWVCGAGFTGNRLPANGAGRCARQGRSTSWILDRYFPKGTIDRRDPMTTPDGLTAESEALLQSRSQMMHPDPEHPGIGVRMVPIVTARDAIRLAVARHVAAERGTPSAAETGCDGLREALEWVEFALGWAVFREETRIDNSNEMRDIRARIRAALALSPATEEVTR